MAWNEPGGSKDRDPWGNRNQDQGPPDIDEVVKKMRDKFGGLFGGGRGRGSGSGGQNAGGIFSIIVLGLVIWLVYDVTYIIDPAERGVVLRFGKYVDSLQPGLNLRLPRPIEQVYRVNVDTVRTTEIGLSRAESYMLTQDQNIVDIQFNIQYRIKDPRAYLFNDVAPNESLRHATESAVRETVGKNDMDFIIKDGREIVGSNAGELVQKIVDDYGTGILITQFNMQKAKEPEEVREAFADAVKAQADEERYKNEADAYQREVLGKAQGAMQRTLQDAEGYRARVVESATGEAKRFAQILTEYEKAPEVTRERLYIEAMEAVLANSTKVMTDTQGSNNLLYLPLDQLMRRQSASTLPGAPGDQTEWSPSSQSTPNSSERAIVTDPRSRRAR
ncbi:MAG: FtsH protease activity modulator HflK [Granulosicoccaceae bacterium]|jgi:membrane protease subunit HflK